MIKRFLLVVLAVWLWGLPLYAQDAAYAQALNLYYRGYYEQALSALSRVPDGTVEGKPILQSLIYLSEHRLDQAQVALSKFPSSGSPEFLDYIRFIELKIALERSDMRLGQDLLSGQWLFTNPFLMRKARLEVADALYQQGRLKEASELATQLLTYAPDPIIAPKAMRLLLLIDLEIRDRTATLKRYGKLISLYPAEDPRLELFASIQKVLGIHATISDCFDSPGQYLSYIRQLFEVRNYVLMADQASRFVVQYAQTPLAGQAHFYHGLAKYHLMNYRAAVTSFERALVYDFNTKNYPQYYYYISHSYLMLQDKKAVENLKVLIERYPKSPYVPWAYYWLCRYEEKRGDYKDFQKHLKMFERNYAKTPQWEQYQWEKKWRLLQKTTRSSESSITIRGLFDQLIDQATVGTKLIGYYTHMGRSLRDGVFQYPIPFQTLDWFKSMYADTEPFPERLIQLQNRVERLYSFGLGQLAAQEVEFLSSQDADVFKGVNLRYLYGTLLAKLRGDLHPDSTLLPEWRADPVQFVKVQIPRFLLRLFYPKAYWDWVSSYSRLYGVDPYLILAIMREESAFDPFAISRTMARGLMQVMPKTGKDVSFRLGLRWVGEDSLYDPELNIRLGAFYFSWLRKQFKGPIYYSIAAYNAGPEVTYQWTRKPGVGASLDQFVAQVPYPETQAYVRRVMNSYMIYRMLYAD